MNGDSITVIRARARRLAKCIHPDGRIEDYDLAKTVDLFTVPVAGLDDVAALLGRLLPRRDCAVVRGEILDPARTQGVRRLAHPDRKTGEAPTLGDVPRHWLALDLDGAARPDGVPAHDIAECASAAIGRLPVAFRGVRCIAQASAGHGIKPGCRLRLWYWCNRPIGGGELTRWLTGAPVDRSVFRPVQPIYTAAPVFADAERDHLPHRIAEVPGRAILPVPSVEELRPPAPRPPRPLPRPTDAGANRYAFAALRNSSARVARTAVNQRHYTIVSEARQLARFVSAGLLAERDIRAALSSAAEQAGKTADEAEAVITWAMAHPSTAPLPAGTTR